MSDIPMSAGGSRPLFEASARFGEPERAATDPEATAEMAGVVANPEVQAPEEPALNAAAAQADGPENRTALPHPAAPAGHLDASGSPWERPAGADQATDRQSALQGSAGVPTWSPGSYTPPTAWDISGYAPPAPIRLEDHPGSQGGASPWLAGPAGSPGDAMAAGGALAAPAPGSAVFGAPWAIPAMASETVAVVPVPPVEVVSERRRRVQLRTSLTIVLFIVGLAAGAIGLRLATPTHPPVSDGFASLDRIAVEPVPASAVAQELVKNDVHGLAQLLTPDALTAIQTQLTPLITFDSVTYVGATTLDHDTLAGYVVRGRDQSGTLGLVGLVIRLRDGQVVAQ